MATFDNCKLTTIRVYHMSERYSYNELFNDCENDKLSTLCEMSSKFHSDYETGNELLLSPPVKLIAPINHINCSKH